MRTVCQHIHCTVWSHFITRRRVAQEFNGSGLHALVSWKDSVFHVSCLVLCRTWHWPQAQVLSHPFHPLLLSFRRSHLCTQALWFSTLVYPAMFHGRVADQHKSHLSQVMSPSRLRIKPSTPWQSSLKTSSPEELRLTGILGQIRIEHQERFVRNSITEDMDEFGKVGAVPIMTQRRALQTRILKMENYEKCWLHHCICKVEGIVNHLERQSHRWNLLHCFH